MKVQSSPELRFEPITKSYSFLGTHPKVVYHKDGGSTHCIRMANPEDDAIENDKNTWFRSPLVGWNGWPSKDLRDAMGSHWKGSVGPKLDDIADDNNQTFNEQLNKAQGDFVSLHLVHLLLSITSMKF